MRNPISRRALLAGLAAPRAVRPPNFLIILSDDQGYGDAGCYGGEIPTPNIDSIARNGVRFTQYYAAGPVCTPSRYGLLTGRYPARSRDNLLDALMPGSKRGIHSGETTVADVLKGRGYRTAVFGKWHLGDARPEFFPTRHGFQQFDGFVHGCIDFFDFTYGGMKCWYRNESLFQPPRGYTTDYITDRALEFLRDFRNRPFLLYLPYNAPHYGKTWYDPVSRKARNALQAPEEYIARFAHIRDKDRQGYAAMVASLDDNIGRLLGTVRELKLEEDTLLVFASDNGGSLPYGGRNGPLRGQKGELFEGGIRVPCAMQWKGRIAPGSVAGQPAGGVDLMPTLCALAGSAVPERVDGRDLRPVLFERQRFERELFWRTGEGDAYRWGDWKYIKTAQGGEMLFDVESDPAEKMNRSSDATRLAEMRERYRRLLASGLGSTTTG